MNEETSLKRVGLIGCGAIGRPVARALLAENAGPHSLAAVLARTARDLDGFPVTDSAEKFLGGGYDLAGLAGGALATFDTLTESAVSAALPDAAPILRGARQGIEATKRALESYVPRLGREGAP